MRNSVGFKKVLAIALLGTGFCLLAPSPSEASFSVSYSSGYGYNCDRSYYGRRHHYRYSPPRYTEVYYVPTTYYYSDSYYQSELDNYVIVTPPSGAVVRTLPMGFQRFVVNRQTYYRYNGVYYIRAYDGYQVVPAPVAEAPASGTVMAPFTVNPNTVETNTNEVTINIPNTQGGYTPITLKKSGNGFVGPQGEFYNIFPSVEQLKMVYGGK